MQPAAPISIAIPTAVTEKLDALTILVQSSLPACK
jgi:hypothetical protein